MDRILVVDADPVSRGKLERLLINAGYRVTLAEGGEAAFETLGASSLDLVVIDARFPDLDGLKILEKLRKRRPRLPVIMQSDTAETADVIKASKLGVFEYVLKPVGEEEWLRLVGMAVETGRLMRQPVNITQDASATHGDHLLGRSQPMQKVYKAIGRVAPTNATVLIRGDSGTGKELVARAIYQHSERVNRPFVIVNCVAIPEHLLESELFGYEKGAFTGADRQRIGKIEYANAGTVFLDEIGDIPRGIQAKLLRLLQEKTIDRIGGRTPIATDVRIIAATNADLEEKIRSGQFREDLYYRINVVTLSLPSLKQRCEDIPPLADYFLAKFSRNLGVRNPGILPEAKAILETYEWPGNVRELANTMEKCLIFSGGRPVGRADVAHLLSGSKGTASTPAEPFDALLNKWIRQQLISGQKDLLNRLTDHVAKRVIVETLAACGQSRSQTAKRLGISRPTLLYRMSKYELDSASKKGS